MCQRISCLHSLQHLVLSACSVLNRPAMEEHPQRKSSAQRPTVKIELVQGRFHRSLSLSRSPLVRQSRPFLKMPCLECIWRQEQLASMDRFPEQCFILGLVPQGLHVGQEQAFYNYAHQQEVFVWRELDICYLQACQHGFCIPPSFVSSETQVWDPYSIPLTLSSTGTTFQVKCSHAVVQCTEILTIRQPTNLVRRSSLELLLPLDRVMVMTSSTSTPPLESYSSLVSDPPRPPAFEVGHICVKRETM